MDIRLFIGAHRTASDHIASVLTQNRDVLIAEDILLISRTRTVRRAFKAAYGAIMQGKPKEDARKELFKSLSQDQNVNRVLLLDTTMIGAITRPYGKEMFYPRVSDFIRQLQTIFDTGTIKLYAATRNPATFIPSCYAETMLRKVFMSYEDFIKDVNLQSLKWSHVLHRLQGSQPNLSVTTWSFEDYPYIWRDVAQAFAGIQSSQDLIGNSERTNVGITLRGAQLMYRYVQEHPLKDAIDFQKVRQAFLEKFPSSPNEITAPNWPPELVAALTNNYEDDWYYIERMENMLTIRRQKFF